MLLIVVSILIAFALDAWWDERAELRQEKAQLRALRTELVESRDRLLEVIESVRHHAANVDRLVTLLEAAGDAPVQVPNELLGSVVSWRTSDIALSSLESLRSSGLLGRLSNPELQAALAGFPAQVEDIQEDEIVGQQFVEFVLAPALAKAGLAKAAYRNRLGFNPEEHGGESTIIPSTELTGLLAARQVHINWSLGGLPEISEAMGALIEQIDRELAKG
jgi:hypothetical protein